MFEINMTGSVYSYAKTMKMNAEAKLSQYAKESDEKTQSIDAEEKARKDFLESMSKEAEISEADNSKTEVIRRKLMLGGELTDKELEHLKSKAPEMYDDYVNAENERKRAEKSYRSALKKCRTKEDVERVRQSAANGYLANAQNISGNRELGKERKAIMIAAEMRKASDVNSSTDEFKKSSEYRRLPDTDREEDKIEKRRKEQQAENAAQKARREKARAAYLSSADGGR